MPDTFFSTHLMMT